jgi:hypothetical protein
MHCNNNQTEKDYNVDFPALLFQGAGAILFDLKEHGGANPYQQKRGGEIFKKRRPRAIPLLRGAEGCVMKADGSGISFFSTTP